jgi:hypothetical protein
METLVIEILFQAGSNREFERVLMGKLKSGRSKSIEGRGETI